MEDISIGDSAIAGRYVVHELLGAGGFAKVYRGEQKTTGQEVAIKLLDLEEGPSAASTEVQLERFRREARFCAELHHPNIVSLIDSGETSDGRVFVVFSLVPGQHLGSVLITEGALEPTEVLHLMTQVIDALSCAHARGIVHRDLKPENIMLSASGARRNALVLDFGIGTMAEDRAFRDMRRVTERGEYLGTPAYSAPEQLRGSPPTLLSDLYAWGLIFLECLTGESPLGATRPHEIIHRQLNPDPIRIPFALQGTELGELLSLVTQKDVEKRQTTAAEVLAALDRIAGTRIPSRESILSRQAERRPSTSSTPATSSLPPPSQLSSAWLVPLGRNPNFTGREDLLLKIEDSLRTSRLFAVVALHGLGGIGKTQLALEYAYRRAERYRLVAWIRAEEPETIATDYSAIAAAEKLSETPNQRQRIETVRSWLEQNDRWLLIFDNAPSAAAIREYLPRSHSGHILVTSRHQSWRDLAASLAVDVLDRDAAIELLLRRTGESDAEKAAELSDELGRLPLALEEAAAYIDATGKSITSYLDLLRAQRQRLLFGESARTDHGATLRTTWELSFRQVELRAPWASELLQVSAFLAPEDVPFSLFRGGNKPLPAELHGELSDEVGFDACMATLRQYSLVRTESDAFSIHRLVQLATRDRLSESERDRWAEVALELVERSYPLDSIASDQSVQSGRLLPHALAALSHTAPDTNRSKLVANMLRRTGIHLSTRGLNERAKDHLERSLALLEKMEEKNFIELSANLWELGIVLYALGEASEARGHLERAVAILEKQAGPAAMMLWAQSHMSLAWVLRTLGDFEATLSVAGRCLERVRQVNAQMVMAMCLSVMARAYWGLNRIAEARQSMEEALDVLGRLEHPSPLISGAWLALAQLALDVGDYDRSLDFATRGYKIGVRGFGRDHPFVCGNQVVQGFVLVRRGDFRLACDHFKRALDGSQRATQRTQEGIAVARSELANVQRLLGDFDEARSHVLHALETLPLVSGDGSRTESQARLAFAAILRDEHNLEAARRECDASLHALGKQYERGHPLYIPTLNLLGWVLSDSGEWDAASDIFFEAIAIAEKAELTRHPDYAESLEGLGVVRSSQGDAGGARHSFVRALGLLQESLGDTHAASLRVGNRLRSTGDD